MILHFGQEIRKPAVRGHCRFYCTDDKILEEAAIMNLIRAARAVVTCDAEDRVRSD